MARVQRFDHVGMTVADLDSVTTFFVGLGLDVEGTGSVIGEFGEAVCGIRGAHGEIAMLRPSMRWLPTGTGPSGASASTRTASGWLTCWTRRIIVFLFEQIG